MSTAVSYAQDLLLKSSSLFKNVSLLHTHAVGQTAVYRASLNGHSEIVQAGADLELQREVYYM